MELPQEIELWYVIPSIRKALVAELKAHGLKQKDIAGLMGLTGPAVSQYLKDKRGASGFCDVFQQDPLKKEIVLSAKVILEKARADSSVVIKEINRLCRLIREKKIICDIHRKQNPKMKSCDVCYEK